MKRHVYRNLYKLLSALSRNINNPHLSRYKIAVGTTLLLLASGCQTAKKNSKNKDGKDTEYSQSSTDEFILCYEPTPPLFNADPNHIHEITEKTPEFPGGSHKLMEFINKNIYLPEEFGDLRIHRKVVVEFVIEKDGSVSNPQILRGIDQKLDEIALEVIHKLPNFEPAMIIGEAVRSRYVVSVAF